MSDDPKMTPATYVGEFSGIKVWTHPAVRRQDIILINGPRIECLSRPRRGHRDRRQDGEAPRNHRPGATGPVQEPEPYDFDPDPEEQHG